MVPAESFPSRPVEADPCRAAGLTCPRGLGTHRHIFPSQLYERTLEAVKMYSIVILEHQVDPELYRGWYRGRAIMASPWR